MDKLTAIRIKYDDGTYSNQIPVGAIASNIEWDSTHSLVGVLGSIAIDKGTIQDQITQLFNEKIDIDQLNRYIQDQLSVEVADWLNQYVSPATGTIIYDTSLSIEGAAAEAKAVGDALEAIPVKAGEGTGSTVEGLGWATGDYSHTEGRQTTASGLMSHAEGWATRANHQAQHVFGTWNIPDPSQNASNIKGNYVEIVGNGTGQKKSNARTLDWNGNEVLAGKLTVGAQPTENMDVATKQYVDNHSSVPTVSGTKLVFT